MKHFLLTGLLFIFSLSAVAGGISFKPYYEGFGFFEDGEVTNVKYKVTKSGRTEFSFRADGTVASCSFELFTLAPRLLIRRKLEILSCNEHETRVKPVYLRKAACDQGMIVNDLSFRAKVPRDCNFKITNGAIIIGNGDN